MHVQALKERIGTLDPKVHGCLIRALAKRCDIVQEDGQDTVPPAEPSYDPFAEAYGEAVDGLNTWYELGAMNYIRKHHPELRQRIDRAESRLEEIWQSDRGGPEEVRQFRDELTVWVSLYRKGVQLFSQEKANKTEY